MRKENITKIAITDIGSNSVRLVIYEAGGRSPAIIYNEKVLCFLGKNLEKTGKLNKEGADLAFKTLQRFSAIIANLNITDVHYLATAAVRDASDGQEFIENVQHQLNLKIRILTGKEEATYAAYGIISGFYQPSGISCDLGGGSFELAAFDNGSISHSATTQLGILRIFSLMQKFAQDDAAVKEKILDEFDKIDFLKNYRGLNFYAIGGGLRNLSKIYIHHHDYPLRILHNFSLTPDKFLETASYLKTLNRKEIEAAGVTEKRVDTIKGAALLLEAVIEYLQPKNIIISAYGIREGFLFDQLDSKTRKEDPFIAGCIDMIERSFGSVEFGEACFNWIKDFTNYGDQFRLAPGICILASLSKYEHTEYRAEFAFKKFLDSNIAGIDHKERVFVASSLYYRYKPSDDDETMDFIRKFLSRDEIRLTKLIGYLIRLAYNISAGSPSLLNKAKLNISKKGLILTIVDSPNLAGEIVVKYLEKLANLLELDYHVVEV